ncbi:MAG: hypothetical protein E7633_10675 [Ruminococcaceae bacterium]|nr:hypothetical protein [Oscillospiraceae bacterium]
MKKIMLAVNILIISAVFYMNYIYQSNGFNFTLKCICSATFAILGVINLLHAFASRAENLKFYLAMSIGLILAFSGDYLIGYDFIKGAATFALGHIFFVIAYCFLERMQKSDYIISGALFAGCLIFLNCCPFLTFDVPIYRAVCTVYALIISFMLGKALGNLIRNRNSVTIIIAFASFLFFFSDLMLVLDWFIGAWEWTDNACMGTYYPALCFLALSMCIKNITKNKI